MHVTPAAAQTPDPIGTDGAVRAVIRSGNTVYLGGSFNTVGRNVPYGVPLDRTSAAITNTAYSKPNGTVNAAIPDGTGGWYIGGSFTQVGTVARNRLAQINSSGQVTAWNPNVSGTVNALVLLGNTVYAGGSFNGANSVNGTTARNRLAAFDATTGTATGWNPNASSTVNALAVSGNRIYAGGSFNGANSVNGTTARNRLAAFDTATGTATAWNPNANGTISVLAASGGTIYAGGSFSGANSVNGTTTRNRLAAFDTATGTATAWDPNMNDVVSALVVSGNTVYAGGSFNGLNSVNGSITRNYLAAINATTGVATTWDPNMNGNVRSLLVLDTMVYAGGSFNGANSVNGTTTRNRLAAFSTITGQVTSWAPDANSTVITLASSGNTIYAGGTFTLFNAVTRNRMAAFDATTGQITAWNPNVSGFVYTMAMSGNTIYAGGSFTTIYGSGNAVRNRLAAFDTTAGLATAWNPNANDDIQAMVLSGGTIYIGGNFNLLNGTLTRNRLAAIDTITGAATAWNPNVNSTVNALVLSGNTLYVGGAFNGANSVNGTTTRNRLAAFDTATGIATAWDPNATGTVSALLLSGNTLYVGGAFNGANSLNGTTTRNRLAAIDATTGTATGWDPNLNGNVNALALSGNTLYAGGTFNGANSVNGTTTRNRLAAFDTATGIATAWDPNVNNTVNTLMISGSTVYTGGSFTTIGGGAAPAQGFAAASLPAAPLPLSLLGIAARAEGSSNVLTWQVAGETPGAAYTVEYSGSGRAFEPIGTVPGNGSAGYRYTHEGVSGSAYYRLRISGAGGAAHYSPVVLVRRGTGSTGSLTLVPQPASSTLSIRNTDAGLNGSMAIVLDVQGRVVARFAIAPSTTLDVSGWAPGQYVLRLPAGEVLRISKQ